MNAKEQLRAVRLLKLGIDSKTERIAQLQCIAESVTQQISDMPHGSREPQRMAHIVETIVDFTAELAEQAAEMAQLQQVVQQTINRIPNHAYRTLLELYYCNGYRWQKVAELLHYSERQIYNMHRLALAEYDKALQACSVLQRKAC